MKVTVIPIVVGALGTIPKGLVKGQEDLEINGQVETIQTTVLLRSARILSWTLEETCCHSNTSEKLLANADVKKTLKGVNNNNAKFTKSQEKIKDLMYMDDINIFAKKEVEILIRTVKVGWLDFYGISTLICYLVLNPIYTYILNIYELKSNSLSVTIFKRARAHLLAHS